MARLNVTQLNLLIQREISFSPFLQKIEVEAEIARLTRHASGHLYFTIKDAFSSIDCVMFRSQASRLKQQFDEGDRVLLKGRISLYEKTARLQFYVQSVEPLGDGVLLKAFEALKAKLEAEGLFDPDKKLPIPRYPKQVALLTSATGAARADFLKVFWRKNPFCEVLEVPVAVQGESVVPDIMQALDQMPESVDLIVITRGGGSYEDLAAFNDEQLARRVSELSVPTISAIGHEVDFTIIEFVTSQRAATPTAAAELATSDVGMEFAGLERGLLQFGARYAERLARLSERMSDRYLSHYQFRLEKQAADMARTGDEFYQYLQQALSQQLAQQRQRNQRFIDQLERRSFIFTQALAQQKQQLDQLGQLRIEQAERSLERFGLFLNHTNPLQTLDRGYSYIEQAGRKLQSVTEIDPAQPLTNYLKDGRVISQIMEVEHEL